LLEQETVSSEEGAIKPELTSSHTRLLRELGIEKITLLSEPHRREWDDFISHSRDSAFYHTVEWAELLQAGTGSVPSYWGLWSGGALAAIWPSFRTRAFGGNVLCFPYSTDGAPLMKDNANPEHLNQIVKHATSEAKKLNVLHWSMDVPKQSRFATDALRLGFEETESPRCAYLLDTTLDAEVLWNNFSHSVRRGIRRARASGLEVVDSNEPADLAAFLSIYQSTMRRNQLSGFRNVNSLIPYLTKLGAMGKAKLFVVKDKGMIVSGALLLLHKRTAHGWIAASRPESWTLRPNELLMWTTFQWASKFGYRMDLGGNPSDPKQGINRFKTQLGGERVELIRLTLPIKYLQNLFCTALVQKYREVKHHGLVPEFISKTILKQRNAWFD